MYNQWRAKLGLRLVTLDEFTPVYERAHDPKRAERGRAIEQALDEAFGVNDTEDAGR